MNTSNLSVWLNARREINVMICKIEKEIKEAEEDIDSVHQRKEVLIDYIISQQNLLKDCKGYLGEYNRAIYKLTTKHAKL